MESIFSRQRTIGWTSMALLLTIALARQRADFTDWASEFLSGPVEDEDILSHKAGKRCKGKKDT